MQAKRTSISWRLWALGLAALLGAALGGAAVAPAAAQSGPAEAESAHRPGGPWEDLLRHWSVERHLRGMSLEERVGQLFVTYAHGETADTAEPEDVAANREAHGVANAEELLERYHLGGVVYFAWSNNVNDPHQIAGLSNGLQESAAEHGDTPLLIATDQEHGLVTRIGPPATQLPGAMALGAAHDTEAAFTAAEISGTELEAMGVNQNFAPVADVNVDPANPVIGVRSFSSDPRHAADMVAAQVEGYQSSGGLASTVKHFPGHGDTGEDSHTDLPRIDHTYEEWTELDAPPFQAAIAAGVGTVMTAHIQFPALDDSLTPATLSEPILTGLLREELGFDGVVVTDSLSMEGVREGYGDDRVPVLALLAGADMLLMPPDIDLAYNAVLEAVESGEITERRLDRSVRRVLELKHELGLFEDPYVDLDEVDEVVGSPEHLRTAQDVSDLTTTLIANDGALPLAEPEGDALVTGWGASTTAVLAEEFAARGWTAEALATGAAPNETDIAAAVEAAAGRDLVVVATNGVADDPAQADLVAALHEAGAPVVAIAVRDPYDVAHHLEDTAAALATYSYAEGGLRSVVGVIFGELAPRGRLPVDIPSAEDPGTALFGFGHGLAY